MADQRQELLVYYTCEGWKASQVKEEDAYAAKLAGIRHEKGSTSQYGVRELTFMFPDEMALNKAKLELKDGGFRFVP